MWDEDTRYGWIPATHGLPPTFPGVIFKKEGYFFTCYLKSTPYQRDGKAPLGNRLLAPVEPLEPPLVKVSKAASIIQRAWKKYLLQKPVEPPLVKVSKVIATYSVCSYWDIKGDLDNAHDWYILSGIDLRFNGRKAMNGSNMNLKKLNPFIFAIV